MSTGIIMDIYQAALMAPNPFFMSCMDDLILERWDKDAELRDGIRWVEDEAARQGVSFYEMAFQIIEKYLAERSAKRWLRSK